MGKDTLLQVRISEKTKSQIEDQACNNNINTSEFVRQAIREKLDQSYNIGSELRGIKNKLKDIEKIASGEQQR